MTEQTDWNSIQPRPIISSLQTMVRGLEAAVLDAEEDGLSKAQVKAHQDEIDRLKGVIERRKTDPKLQVKIRHIGGIDDPYAAELLKAEDKTARFDAEIRVKTDLLKKGQAVTDASVRDAIRRDPEFIKWGHESSKRWMVAGLEDAEETRKRIFNIGGPSLIVELTEEVKRWQSVGWEEGED